MKLKTKNDTFMNLRRENVKNVRVTRKKPQNMYRIMIRASTSLSIRRKNLEVSWKVAISPFYGGICNHWKPFSDLLSSAKSSWNNLWNERGKIARHLSQDL